MASAIVSRPGKVQAWAPTVALASIAVLALGLRLHLLGWKSFWLDEGVSASIARLPWSDFLKLLWRSEANMSFYYLLLRGWTGLGDSEFVIRSLSVVFAIATLLIVYVLGRRLFGTQGGLFAALLLATNAFHLRYSQEARSYSLLIFLVTLSTYLFVRMVDSPSGRNCWTYAATSVLAFYTHFFAIFVVTAHLVALVLWDRQERGKSPFLKTAGWIVALSLPGILFMLLKNRGQLDWIPAPTVASLRDFLLLFTGQSGAWLALAYGVLCALPFLPMLRRRGEEHRAKKFALTVMASWLLVPIVAPLVISIVRPLFMPRYAAMCLPALALLAAAALQDLKPPPRLVALAAIVLLSSIGIRNYYTSLAQEGEDWRDITSFVVANSAAGDGLIFDNGISRPVFEYYRGSTSWPRVLYPEHGGALTYRDFEGIATPQVAKAAAESYPRVWLIAREASALLKQRLSEKLTRVEERQFRGATVELYARPAK